MKEPMAILSDWTNAEICIKMREGFNYKGTVMHVDESGNILLRNPTISGKETNEMNCEGVLLVNGSSVTHVYPL